MHYTKWQMTRAHVSPLKEAGISRLHYLAIHHYEIKNKLKNSLNDKILAE